MLDLQGHLAECTSSNIFFVKDGVLHTPSLRVGILDGITRGLIIEQGRERGVEVHEGEYTLERLLEADEVFITNTTTEVMPVRGVNEKTFRVGNMAKRLREAYQVLVRTEEEEWE
jgi:branched-chain amino acid aminotransferase